MAYDEAGEVVGLKAMTVYEDEIPARRSGVGAKVLGLACAILAILAAFWGIVWFIRSYVEPPRVMMPAALQLASRDSVPVPTPKAAVDRLTEEAKPTVAAQAPPPPAVRAIPPPPPPAAASQPDPSQTTGSVADRWGPMNQVTPPPAPAAAPAPQPAPVMSAPAGPEPAPAALATAPERDPDEVVEGSVPAIDGPAPLPRRRPVMTAQRRTDPPLPRPRPDGQVAPAASVFIAVPTTDDRYPGQ